jgi:ERCC4-related helicase
MNAYHKEFGLGAVLKDEVDTLLVEFESGIKRCLRKDLNLRESPADKIAKGIFGDFEKCLVRTQGALIIAINNAWGVFSISRIALLPHQLWVCNQVFKQWPIRYLIADDVGLGKTIEAGLILWPLISSGRVKRLLILTPAALVEQWVFRLYSMFGIRLAKYTADQDKDGTGYWDTHPMVAASYSTLQLDNKNRHERIFSAEPWDIVVVDEAHHMNYDKKGKTLAYQLLEKMEKRNLAPSRLLFTGTPHRGKEFGFLSLMRLVEPAKFDPDPHKEREPQYTQLSQYMIRNNKQNAVDMNGRKLFKPIRQHPITFEYSDEETEFYNQLTEFINSGKTYAHTLNGEECNQVILVLIVLQKIASSSVAAIRSALATRKIKIEQAKKDFEQAEKNFKQTQVADILKQYENIDEVDDDDEATKKYKEILEKLNPFLLMEEEIEYLEELIELADKVKSESRITKILEIIKNDYPDEQILFFTEYKRTQALMINALRKEYGENSAGFINGDNYLFLGGDITLRKQREITAQDFNKGLIKYLVSTEAAGEGIDLQENCHVLIHIDLPWNPMRLHQRVGRLNRYGQKHAVDVISLRNPDTVESLIWEKLVLKIGSIIETFNAVMEDPEDMFYLVLGMKDNNFYNNLYAKASAIKGTENFSAWFDAETKTLGGKETITTLEKMIGHVAKFDLSGLNGVPKLDLPDLEPFFKRSLKLVSRRLKISPDSFNPSDEGTESKDSKNSKYTFNTPDEWKTEYGVSQKYENIFFRRELHEGEETKLICGVGHKIFQKALEHSQTYPDAVCLINSAHSYFVYRIYDKITDYSGVLKSHYLTAELHNPDKIKWLSEIEFFPILNSLKTVKASDSKTFDSKTIFQQKIILEKIEMEITREVDRFNADYKKPGYELFSVFLAQSLFQAI